MLLKTVVTLACAVLAQSASTIVLPTSSFSSTSTLTTYWNYLYPWGSDHNGCMSQVPFAALASAG